ncbi:hypothetical protein [Gordonia terrae]
MHTPRTVDHTTTVHTHAAAHRLSTAAMVVITAAAILAGIAVLALIECISFAASRTVGK